jgi:hypothetical protein
VEVKGRSWRALSSWLEFGFRESLGDSQKNLLRPEVAKQLLDRHVVIASDHVEEACTWC